MCFFDLVVDKKLLLTKVVKKKKSMSKISYYLDYYAAYLGLTVRKAQN